MTQKTLSFPKEEKLHHRSLVEGLFREGSTLYEFPLRLTWRKLGKDELEKIFKYGVPEGIGRLQMMVTVPKKKRRHAVDRVLLRRRIREAYRLNRIALKESIERNDDIRTLGIAFIYLHDANLDYEKIESRMKSLLHRLEGIIGHQEEN